LSLALVPVPSAPAGIRRGSCLPLRAPTQRTLDSSDRLTLTNGGATVMYLDPSGGRSPEIQLRAGTFVALAGPLRLRLAPSLPGALGPTVVCT
jgi:hypothetical protein